MYTLFTLTAEQFADESAAFQSVIARHPSLSYGGWMTPDPTYPPTPLATLDDPRHAYDVAGFASSRLYIKALLNTLEARKWVEFSYSLKHRVEETWIYANYVSNGVATAAAISLGLELSHDGINSNIHFELSREQVIANKLANRQSGRPSRLRSGRRDFLGSRGFLGQHIHSHYGVVQERARLWLREFKPSSEWAKRSDRIQAH